MTQRKWLVVCFIASLVGSIDFARADTVTATWTNPATNNNGTAIPATGPGSLTSARLEYGTCSAPGVFGTKAGEVVRNMPVTTVTLNLDPGTTCLRVRVTNTFGFESAPSVVATKTVTPPTPSAPTNLTVSDPVAYDVRPNESTFAFDRGRIVGKCKVGAACDESRTTGDGYFAVERPSRCIKSREARSTALVAKCG